MFNRVKVVGVNSDVFEQLLRIMEVVYRAGKRMYSYGVGEKL